MLHLTHVHAYLLIVYLFSHFFTASVAGLWKGGESNQSKDGINTRGCLKHLQWQKWWENGYTHEHISTEYTKHARTKIQRKYFPSCTLSPGDPPQSPLQTHSISTVPRGPPTMTPLFSHRPRPPVREDPGQEHQPLPCYDLFLVVSLSQSQRADWGTSEKGAGSLPDSWTAPSAVIHSY